MVAPQRDLCKHTTPILAPHSRESIYKNHRCICISTSWAARLLRLVEHLRCGVLDRLFFSSLLSFLDRLQRLYRIILAFKLQLMNTTMASFITNLFPSSQAAKHDGMLTAPPPPLQTRVSQNEPFYERPSTPNRNSFITPVSTPQGSPSKKQNPPGANDLPVAFDNAMKLAPTTFGSPTKSSRGTPLSPGKSNTLAVDESYFSNATVNVDDSIVHKCAISPGSPLRKQGKENTPPTSRQGQEPLQTQAALFRQELYQSRDQNTKKYNTQRGLTSEELEILKKPNVKRLANVTQLCRYSHPFKHNLLIVW